MLGFLHRITQTAPTKAPREPALARGGTVDSKDAALMQRVIDRDQRAFETLYRIYHPRLVRFLSLITQRGTIVEEALNDTMLAVWNRAHTYNGQCKVSTWVFAIAYRTACKALRWQDAPADPSVLDDHASEDDGPEAISSSRETQAALARALESLSHEQRNVVVLTYFHDLPYQDIAQVLDCPVDTVKTRMFHARRKLRVLLQDELGDRT
jgi:RNA polymerase sigma-70 factor (ECF subfamily)